MIGLKLAIEQGKAAGLQPGYQPRQRDFGSVSCPADHAFAEKGTAQCQPVKAADQPIVVPALDRVGMAHRMQPAKNLLDRMVDPGLWSARRARRAQRDYVVERNVGGNAESVRGNCLAQRARRAKGGDRQDRPLARLDPINTLGLAVIGHRKHADRIGAEDELRVERGHRGYGGGCSQSRQGG